MRFRPRHHEQRKGRGHHGIAEINGPTGQPRVMAPLLQRPKDGMQQRRRQCQHQGQLVSCLCALQRCQPCAHIRHSYPLDQALRSRGAQTAPSRYRADAPTVPRYPSHARHGPAPPHHHRRVWRIHQSAPRRWFRW